MSLEDETGISNIVIHPDLSEQNRLLLISEPFLWVEGILQNRNNVTSIRARKFQPIPGIEIDLWSRNFC